MKKALIIVLIVMLGISSLMSQSNGLYFSEYCEGSSNNKYLELYNSTGNPIDLTNYDILTNYNGGAWTGMHSFPAGTTLAAGDVWVIANDAADASILAVADEIFAWNASGYIVGFNGDDVRALVTISPTDTTIHDIIGLYDFVDPGDGWPVAGVPDATKEHTLVRKADVCFGNPDWNASAGTDSLNSEWIVYPQDDFSHVGSHFSSCFMLNIVINEIITSSDTSYLDTTSNSYDDWVELFNPGNSSVNLLGWHLTDDINDTTNYTFPDTTLQSGEYLIVWCDDDPGAPGLHAPFKLDKSGEELHLFDDIVYVDGIVFGPQKKDTSLARIPNGTGAFTFAMPTPMAVNALFPVPTVDTIPPVVTSASATSLTQVQVVFNEEVNNSALDPLNYTGLGAIAATSWSMNHETITLTLTVPLQICVFDTLIVSNVEDTTGNVMAVPQEFPLIFGCQPPEIVITEIMYNPPESGMDSLEFVELYNNGTNAVDLNGYSFTQGFVYTFPSMLMNPGEYILVAGNATAFQNTFGIMANEWTSGALSNGGEDIELMDNLGNVVDYVNYSDKMPWDTLADGAGPSLTLCDPGTDNNDPANWRASIKFAAVNADGDSIFATPNAPCMTVGFGRDINDKGLVQIYPNPSKGSFIIEMPEDAEYEVSIYSMIGKMVYNTTSNERKFIVNIDNLKGFYFINIYNKNNGKYFSGKLILQ